MQIDMQIELKHIAPYILYEPNYIWLDTKERKVLSVDISLPHLLDYMQEKECYLILRPLSDLVKEIEVNGERFVPMHELFRIAFDRLGILKAKYKRCKKNNSYTIFATEATNMMTINEFTYWGNDKLFSSIRYEHNNNANISNTFEMYQKLFEWHFDVFGLIEKGLALDINTIDNANSH